VSRWRWTVWSYCEPIKCSVYWLRCWYRNPYPPSGAPDRGFWATTLNQIRADSMSINFISTNFHHFGRYQVYFSIGEASPHFACIGKACFPIRWMVLSTGSLSSHPGAVGAMSRNNEILLHNSKNSIMEWNCITRITQYWKYMLHGSNNQTIPCDSNNSITKLSSMTRIT
jgi:hypothetical protein